MTVKIQQSNPGWLKRLLKSYGKGSEIVVGFPIGSEGAATQYPDGTPVIDVAVYNEFGTSNIPERPFLRTGSREFVEESGELFKKAVKRVNAGGDFKQETEKIGLKAMVAVQTKITNISSPGNAESTIKRKKSSNPLVDTGLLRQSVTYEVR